MKNLSDFKKRLKVGVKLQAINHTMFAGRDENGNPLYKDFDFGIREISIVQSNSFALKTIRTDNKVVDSWCSYPKAKELVINNENSVTILCEQSNGKLEPILTYTFVD